MSTQGDKLKAIADAIRALEGSTGNIIANDFPARIRGISGDATAAAGDIARNKTAYVKGKKITGTVETVSAGSKTVNSGYAVPYVSGSTLKVDGYRAQDTLYRTNGILTVDSQLSSYGDATAEDVAQGKTFTSAAGLKVVGMAKNGLTPISATVNISTGIISAVGEWETIVATLYVECIDNSSMVGNLIYLYVPDNVGNITPISRLIFPNSFMAGVGRTYVNGKTEFDTLPNWESIGDIRRVNEIDAFGC